MRIVIPSVIYPDSFADCVTDALRDMGHEVITQSIQPTSKHSGRSIFRKAALAYDMIRQKMRPLTAITPVESWLLKTCRERKPTMLLTLTQSIQESVLHEIKSLGVTHRVCWWGDPPGYIQRLDLMSSEWDALFIKDNAAAIKFRILGINAYLLHEAMHPKWHRPIANQQNNQVIIAGNFYGPRQVLTRRLVRDGIEVGLYGNLPFSDWSYPEVKKNFAHKYIVKDEKSKVFGEGLACLNSNCLAEGDSLNCRAFEIAGTGGLQLIEDKASIEQCFEPGLELLPYRTYEQLIEHVARAKVDRSAMNRIREAGTKRANAEHTYTHRLNAIFRTLGIPTN